MNADDFDDAFTSEDLHTFDQIEQAINTKSEGITSNPDQEKQDYLDLIFEDLHTLDQIEQTINTKSEEITSNPDKEKQDYLDLKTYFLDNAIPSNLSFLATLIGFPRQVYDCIEADHPRRCLDRMQALFDLWYPIAKEIGHKNGLLPVHILAYATYSFSGTLQRAPKLLGTDLRAFVQGNEKLINKVIDQTPKMLKNSNFSCTKVFFCHNCGANIS
jgi:hypothetical protein